MDELTLLAKADARGRCYTDANEHHRVFPSDDAIAALTVFDEPLPVNGWSAENTLALLDDVGAPATTASNRPRYFGFVIGAALPHAGCLMRLICRATALWASAPALQPAHCLLWWQRDVYC